LASPGGPKAGSKATGHKLRLLVITGHHPNVHYERIVAQTSSPIFVCFVYFVVPSPPPQIPEHRFLRQLRSFPFDARCCISHQHLVKSEVEINSHYNIRSHNCLRAGPTHGHIGFARHIFALHIARRLPILASSARFPSRARPFFSDASPRLAAHHAYTQARRPRPTSTTLRRIARAHHSAIHSICGAPGVFVTNSMGKLEESFRLPAVIRIETIAMREQRKPSPIRRPNTRNDKVSVLAGKRQLALPSNSRLRTNPSLSDGATRITLRVLAALAARSQTTRLATPDFHRARTRATQPTRLMPQ
jgi:hypothetical protein